MDYTMAIERGWENLAELLPLYATHYREMQDRLNGDGLDCPEFNPRIDQYIAQWQAGSLINYVARTSEGEPVGYSNVYLALDMHNSEPIAQEDTIFVLKDHRRGLGRRLANFVLDDLRARGVRRLSITAVTDTRAVKLWQRMGFKPVAQSMTYFF